MSAENEKEAGRRAATAHFNRYGQEAVLLRASKISEARGGKMGSGYALGFWLQACKLAGLDSKETDQ